VLQRLSEHGADLFNPETVKDVISKERVTTNTKNHYVTGYDGFIKWLKIPWKPPTYNF